MFSESTDHQNDNEEHSHGRGHGRGRERGEGRGPRGGGNGEGFGPGGHFGPRGGRGHRCRSCRDDRRRYRPGGRGSILLNLRRGRASRCHSGSCVHSARRARGLRTFVGSSAR